jgi:signal transduction histidine kinase
VGQLIVVILFSVLAVGNLLWQFYQDGIGDFDIHLNASAKTFLAALEPNANNGEQLRQDAALLDKVIRETMTLEKTNQSVSQSDLKTVIRLFDGTGKEIFRSPGFAHVMLPNPNPNVREAADAELKCKWRIATASSANRSLTAQIAQSTNVFDDGTADTISRFILWPLLVFLPFAGLVTWFTAARGIAPMHDLAELIAKRSPTDLTPLTGIATHKETEPLINEINSLLHKLDTTLTRERNFLADAAHELRTPLAVVQAQVHVLKYAKTEEEKNLASDELNIGVARAASLIQKLLLTARVSVVDFEPRFEVTDLTAFVQEHIATFSVLVARKNIEMSLNAPASCNVSIDRETFGSAIDNVLDNAIRYTPEGGTILIEFASLTNNHVQLRIADNGVGIPLELHERVFERFYRVAGTEQQGSGLGLAIVRRVLALHGGSVALSSGLDQRGLAVDLTIPTLA